MPVTSSVRYSMILATTAVAVMLYLDRACLGILNVPIKSELSLSKGQFEDLTSAFFWAYALAQLPAGWLGDRLGPRAMLSLYLFFWSMCTALMGLAAGLPMLILLRLGCGLFEAGAYPLASGIVRTWMPAAARARASGAVAVGGRLGGAIAPPLTLWLAGEALGGWRIPFVVYGLLGMVGAIGFFLWFRNRPADHPAVNEAERALIGEPESRPTEFPPLGAFVLNRPLWLCSLVQFISNFAWGFILTLFPSYLTDVHNVPAETRAWYQAIPLYAGIVGMLLGGWVSDAAIARFGPRWGRSLPIAMSRLAIGAAYVGCLIWPDPFVVMLMMMMVAFATDLGMAPMWAWTQDVGGRHTGSVMGWANMWGNFGAAVFPLVMKQLNHWPSMFALCAAIQILAAAAAWGMDARRPIGQSDRTAGRD